MSKMTLQAVIDHLDEVYQAAQDKPHIRKPLSWALYQTWQWVDSREKETKHEKEKVHETP